jgi:hypothetical protein
VHIAIIGAGYVLGLQTTKAVSMPIVRSPSVASTGSHEAGFASGIEAARSILRTSARAQHA